MALEIEITEVGNGGRRVALRGRLDSLTAPMLDERLELVLPAATAQGSGAREFAPAAS